MDHSFLALSQSRSLKSATLAPDAPRTLKVSGSKEVGPREDRLGEEKNQQQLVINYTGILEDAAV